MSKVYDIAVKTGSYTDKSGREKGRWKNIGSIIDKGDGPFMLLDPTFNAAGVERQAGRDMLMCSLFKPDAQSGQQDAQVGNDRSPGGNDEPDDQIPF